MVGVDGSGEVSYLCISPKCRVSCKLLGSEVQVSITKLLLLCLSKVSLQIEHDLIEHSSNFLM